MVRITEFSNTQVAANDLNCSANKNRFFEQWMLDHGHATRDAEGKIIPEEPVQPARIRDDNSPSYIIRPCWFEYDEQKGEAPAYPWVAEMMGDYLKAKKLQTRRDTIAEQYELLHGKGWAFNHKKTKA